MIKVNSRRTPARATQPEPTNITEQTLSSTPNKVLDSNNLGHNTVITFSKRKPRTPKPIAFDSSEVCHNRLEVNIGFSGVRKHTSIRCDSKLWKTFKSVCKNNGISTCDILEKLILGFSVGYSTRVAQPTTINVIVDAPRVVKRVRRRQLVYEDEVQENYYDSRGGWTFKPGYPLNENGHAEGCNCARCRRTQL